jgi:hypothetical protein
MANTDPRVDAYIEKSADFAKPILAHMRSLVHKNVPGVTETIKWGMPAFEFEGPLCSMAAFKHHCVFGFWKAALMKGSGLKLDSDKGAMGHAGKIQSMKDLPADKVFKGWLQEAARLNREGIKLPARNATPKPEPEIPAYFSSALRKNKKAMEQFRQFSPSHRREYIEWITGAKTEPTREKRVQTSIEWLSEGKGFNWKYQAKK